MTYDCLIVDDEKLIRDVIKEYCCKCIKIQKILFFNWRRM